MKRKLRVTLDVLENVSVEYTETEEHIEGNLKGICEREHITVEDVIYFVVFCFFMHNVCLFLRF